MESGKAKALTFSESSICAQVKEVNTIAKKSFNIVLID